jgi:hypothetical protein
MNDVTMSATIAMRFGGGRRHEAAGDQQSEAK